MDWIKPETQLPPQGKKILYFSKGDIYVVQRYGKYWVPIPFSDSKYRFTEAPELWADIEPPSGYFGKLFVYIDGQKMDVDDFETYHPSKHQELVRDIFKSFINEKDGE